MSQIKIVGLTGQTGAGKSTVSKIMRTQGIEVIDCDAVTHAVANEEKSCLADLALEFSILILNEDGSLNRKKLGAIVFSDAAKLQKLNSIIFPYIKRRIAQMVEELARQNKPLVVLDAPTLFESGLDADCDYIISVIAPLSERQSRIIIRDHLTDDEARKRISSQHDDAFYTERASFVIQNDGDEQDLKIKTLEMIEHMCRTFSRERTHEKS